MTKICIGVMGCGWLGLPLALELKAMNYQVRGSTTSPEKLDILSTKGIEPYLLGLSESGIDGNISGFLQDLSVAIINVPPNLRREQSTNYVAKMRHLFRAIVESKLENVIFISSTSVYGEQEGDITEDTVPRPKTESAKQLLEVENLLPRLKLNTTIIRFGGLIGPDRHPVYHLSQKKGLQNGEELINLIHLDDCIHMIKTILKNKYWNEVFNGVYPRHPVKKVYYTKEAFIRNIDKPEYVEPTKKVLQKKIQSKNFLNKDYSFLTSIFS